MNGTTEAQNPLRAFVRGTWVLLLVQCVVAVAVFAAITFAGFALNRITGELAQKQSELVTLRAEFTRVEGSVRDLRETLRKAHDATPLVRSAIIAFHNRRYEDAIAHYGRALELDPTNTWVRDLLSYSQYMAGRTALRSSDMASAERHFADAVASVRQVLAENPDYIGGYVELAVYECARGRTEAAMGAYEAAIKRSEDATDDFIERIGEIPQACTALRRRIAATQ
jgi:cytochrome c-type biogenesis protein CcmH/NrfG